MDFRWQSGCGGVTVVVGLCLVVDLVVVRCGGVTVPSKPGGEHYPKVEHLRYNNNNNTSRPLTPSPRPVLPVSVPLTAHDDFHELFWPNTQPRDTPVTTGL